MRSVGDRYEKIVSDFLVSKDFSISDRNYSCRYGEIDIVCKKKSLVFFIEVKFRKSFDDSIEFFPINQHKINKIVQTSEFWLLQNSYDESDIGAYLGVIITENPRSIKFFDLL